MHFVFVRDSLCQAISKRYPGNVQIEDNVIEQKNINIKSRISYD